MLRILRLPTILGLGLLAALVLLISPFGGVTPALADAPGGTINVDSIDGNTVNLSGNWSFDACDPDPEENDDKLVSFGIFIDGNDPREGPSEDTVMHFPADQVDSGIPGQVPCTNDTGNWSDSHELTPGTHTVCVVFYDPHTDKLEESGEHSLILAGSDRNTDNSFEKNDPENAFPEGACTSVTTPEVETAALTPTPTATPAPTVTPAVLAVQQLPTAGGTPSDGGSLPSLLLILFGAIAIVVVAATARQWSLSNTTTRITGTRDGRDAGWTWMRPEPEDRPSRRR